MAFWPGTPTEEILRVGMLADKAGLDSLWVTESTLAPGRDAFTLLGALSNVTTQAKLATGIVNIFTRTPTLIASTAATLDELSKGRTILGLGTGHQDQLTKWHSVKFEKPVTRMGEYVETVRLVLNGGPVNYQGATLAIRDFKLAFQPRRVVPIYVAAVGPKMAQLAGSTADGVLVTLNTQPQLKKLLAIAATTARDRGRKIDMAAYGLSFISDDMDMNLKAAQRVLAAYCSASFYQKLFTAAGYEREAREIANVLGTGDRQAAYDLVNDRMIGDFAALGIEETIKLVESYREAGVNLPIMSLAHTDGFEQSASRLFSEIRR